MTGIDGYIHFFDIKSKLPGVYQSWSPNTLKVRMTLNYKRLPYVESFISYPDIKVVIDHFGIPYDVNWDEPRPTLPAIVHYSSEGKVIKAIGNSPDIVRYLDSISPDFPVFGSPRLEEIGWGRNVEAYALASRILFAPVWMASWNIIMPNCPGILDERGAQYFIEDRSTWEERGNKSPLLWVSEDPEDDWKAFLPPLKEFVKVLGQVTPENPYMLGSKPCYADFVFAAWLAWLRRCREEDFQRIVNETGGEEGVIAKFWKSNVQWIEAQGKVVEWVPESQ